MKCKYCGNNIPDGSIYCNHCGEKQIRSKKKTEISVPKPKRLKSGEYYCQMMVKGEVVYINDCWTEAEYYTKARAIKLGMLEMAKHPERITVSQAIDKYIESRANRLRPKSKQQYEYIRDKRFTELMKMQIGSVSSAAIDAAIEAELDKPSRKGGTIKPKTVIDAYHLVATVLKKYVDGIKIDVTLPELQQKLMVIVPPEDIVPVILDTDVELPCMLAMWLGLSMAEIRGITKSKSINGNKLYIVETVVDLNTGPVREAKAKEEMRKRVLDIPPYIMDLINKVEGDVIEPRSGHAVYMRFQKVLEGTALPKMTFHALRHVNASVMADELIPAVVAQARGGWKTDSVMKKTYTHAFDNSRREADKKIDARFNKILNPEPPKEPNNNSNS